MKAPFPTPSAASWKMSASSRRVVGAKKLGLAVAHWGVQLPHGAYRVIVLFRGFLKVEAYGATKVKRFASRPAGGDTC